MRILKYWNVRDWAIVIAMTGYVVGIVYMIATNGM